jgi:chromosome partitioning protein
MTKHFNEFHRLMYMAPKIIAIINMKGGVGKTTLTWNLAQHLFSNHGKKVLIVDLDPQANATILGLSEEEFKDHKQNKRTIADMFINCYRKYGPFPKQKSVALDNYKDYIFRREESRDKQAYLDLIPSELDLSAVLKGAYIDPFMLYNALSLPYFEKYDYILIDCAPTNSILTTLSLNAARKILVPVMADTFAVYGVELMLEVLRQHKEDYNVDVFIIGLVFMRWEEKKSNQQDFKEKIVAAWGETTFRTPIRNNDWYKIANGRRTDISQSAAHEEVKQEFNAFTREFIEKTK